MFFDKLYPVPSDSLRFIETSILKVNMLLHNDNNNRKGMMTTWVMTKNTGKSTMLYVDSEIVHCISCEKVHRQTDRQTDN